MKWSYRSSRSHSQSLQPASPTPPRWWASGILSLVCGILFLAAPALADAAGGLAGLVIAEKTYDAETSTLSLTLRNDSGRYVTAWAVAVVHGRPNGAAGRRVRSLDYFSGLLAGDLLDESRLLGPGETTSTALVIHRSKGADGSIDPLDVLDVAPYAVIFDDASYAGDPGAVEGLFWNRTAGLLARREFLTEIDRDQAESLGGAEIRDYVAALRKRRPNLPKRIDESYSKIERDRWAVEGNLQAELQALSETLAGANDVDTELLFAHRLDSFRESLTIGPLHIAPAYESLWQRLEVEP